MVDTRVDNALEKHCGGRGCESLCSRLQQNVFFAPIKNWSDPELNRAACCSRGICPTLVCLCLLSANG